MRTIIGLLFMFTVIIPVMAQNAYKYELAGHWNDTNIASQSTPFSDTKQVWNDLIGWTHPKSGKEFVIIGSIDSIYFFDISEPDSIRKCGVFWGKNRVINRDVETYLHYAYAVSDNGPKGALQIFDLQYLPDSVLLIKEDTVISKNTHSFFIDSISKRMYMNSTRSSFQVGRDAMQIFSLADPVNPTYMGRLNPLTNVCENVHEAYFRNDTAYCSCEYKGLQIFDLRDLNNQKYIGGISPPYPFNGYNHTSTLNEEGTRIVFTDELPYGLPLKIYDSKNKSALDYIGNFNSHPGATPHNVFWVGDKLYTSAYQDGMYVWDMTNNSNPKVFGYYDTHPQNPDTTYTGLTGCWGVFPYFKSGLIAASDMKNGLFLLKFNQSVGLSKSDLKTDFTLYPNPFNESISISIPLKQNAQVLIQIRSINGQIKSEQTQFLSSGIHEIILENQSHLSAGMYILSVITDEITSHKQIVKY